MTVCFLAMKNLFLHKNCVCVRTELWKGWDEKEARLKGPLDKGRLSHTLTSAAQSPSVPAYSQRECLVTGVTRGGTGTHCLKWPFSCNVSQFKRETSRSQQRTSRGFGTALPTSPELFVAVVQFFSDTWENRRRNSGLALYLLQSKGLILRLCRRAAGFC